MIKWNVAFTWVLCLLAISVSGQAVSETWNQMIIVASGIEDFPDESLYAYSIIAYEGKESVVRNLLIDKVKAKTDEKVTRKKVIRAMKVSLPEVNVDLIDIKAITVDIEESDNVNVILSFSSKDQVVSPTDFPEADKVAREIMYNLAVSLNQSVVTAQIEKAKTDMSTLENKQLAFSNQREALNRNLASTESKLAELENENGEINANLRDERAQMASLKAKADASTSSKEDLEKYDDAQKYISQVEEQLLKNEQASVTTKDKINQTQGSIQEKQKELEELSEQMDRQDKFIALLYVKRDAIK